MSIIIDDDFRVERRAKYCYYIRLPMSFEIGFAEISEVYRNERNSKSLTKVRPDFYEKAKDYLESLEKDYSELGSKPSSAQAMMLQDEIKKVKKRLGQIYDHRERKISLAALSGACGGEAPKHMTKLEKHLYSNLVDVLRHYRESKSCEDAPPAATELAAEEIEVVPRPDVAGMLTGEVGEMKADESLVLRVLKDVPSFAGADRVYNLKKADIVTLPATFADVLVSRGAAKVLEG